jgi:hypothetical protein
MPREGRGCAKNPAKRFLVVGSGGITENRKPIKEAGFA